MLLLLLTNKFIHIQQLRFYSRLYLFAFNGVFLIHEYIHSHLRDLFIHIQQSISVHIHDLNVGSTWCNIQSTFSAHSLCTSLGPSSLSIIYQNHMADERYTNGQSPQTQVLHGL